jgi:hypothetical protein
MSPTHRSTRNAAFLPVAEARGILRRFMMKVFYDLQLIEHLLDALGFVVTIQKLDDIFFFLQARSLAA